MDILTIWMGFLLLVYGLYALLLRLLGRVRMFRKLNPMKKSYGNKTGTIIHFVLYILVPIVMGIGMIWAGLHGVGFIRVFTK
jgi:cytochrome b561